MEIFDSVKTTDIRIEKHASGISGFYKVDGIPFVADIELGELPEYQLKFANVAFARLNDDGSRDYQLQQYKVSPYRAISGLFNLIIDQLPSLNVQGVVFAAVDKNGDVGGRMSVYNGIANKLVKIGGFGIYAKDIKTKYGKASIITSGELTDEQRKALTDYITKNEK